jgi:hypothetical protein
VLKNVISSILRPEPDTKTPVVSEPSLSPMQSNRLDCDGQVRFLYDNVFYNVVNCGTLEGNFSEALNSGSRL